MSWICRTIARPLSSGRLLCRSYNNGSISPRRGLKLSSVGFQKDELRFSERHEWARIESTSPVIARVGISDYAQSALGDVVYVQLPDVDSKVTAGDEVGAVESVKAASEIYTPVSGTVTEINTGLEEKPSLVNSKCYEDGWLFKVQMTSTDDFNKLMTKDSYDKYLKEIKTEDGH